MRKRRSFRAIIGAEPFADRFATDSARAVDVIIPIVHTNELWRSNLISIYREIPVNRLLIGDGGCIDDSLEVARQFPRVEVLDHRNFTSLGYSIRHLIEAVETEWFVYLHSDVFLPPGWFETMFASAKRVRLVRMQPAHHGDGGLSARHARRWRGPIPAARWDARRRSPTSRR